MKTQLAETLHPPERVVSALLVSPFEEDREFLRQFFAHTNWKLNVARTCREASLVMRDHPVSVIVTERELPGEDWKALVPIAAASPTPPVIVAIYRFSESGTVNQLLEAGAYDVLAKPFQENEVGQVISFAWLHWMRKCDSAGEAQKAALDDGGGGSSRACA